MRDNDDGVPGDGTAGGSLAEGLGETVGTFGDGEGELPADDGDAGDAEVAEDEADTTVDGVLDGAGLPAESGSPLEGVGYLLDELHGALFGDDDDAGLGDAAAGALDPDAAELETDTDLDLTGDGVVDGADLHEARSVLDFDVD